MMPHMGDALLPYAEREASLKYRRFKNMRDVYRQVRPDLVEVRAIQLTPGMTRETIDILFRWNRHVQDLHLKPLVELDDEALPLAQANFEQATAEDGEAMLRTILENRPNFSRYVPLYVSQYLRMRRNRGASGHDLAKEFNTTYSRIQRWWSQDIFDPFTGLLRDQAMIHRGKRAFRRHVRVLGI